MLAARTSAVLALDCSGVESRQRRGRTRRGEVHRRLVWVEDREDGHDGVPPLLGVQNKLDAFHDPLRLVP
eukprot:14876641-Alexandrium_andersonii.AAC.1